jgi:hypothetical protein
MTRSSFSKIVGAFALVLMLARPASAEPWRFGIISDTQWPTSPDGKNPYTDAVNVVRHVNQEFIRHGVKFVVQVGDLTDKGTTTSPVAPASCPVPLVDGACPWSVGKAAMDVRATFAQDLYNAGIGFFPLRGNHESNAAAATEFLRIYPQTGSGVNNQTPADALVATTMYGAQAVRGGPFTVGSGFATEPGFEGLTYAFDFDNARFVLYDQFTPTSNASHSVMTDADAKWIGEQVAARPAGGHAFLFAHKGFITENHQDTLFGADPSANAPLQNTLMASLAGAGVRYHFGGHDHVHNRAIVTSPDGASTIQNVIAASDSYKFYIPQVPSNDARYDLPAFGFLRENQLAQEMFTVGYYIVTVDGPQVTVDYWASPNDCNGDCDETNDVIPYTFTKRETFGYSLNGKEFVVPQDASYTVVSDAFQGTTANILDGHNGSGVKDYAGRAVSHAVDTGWTPRACGSASAALRLWGMSSMVPGIAADETDTYVLSMSYGRDNGHWKYGTGRFGIQARDGSGEWVPAVSLTGGEKRFGGGPWKPGYALGTYGVDPRSKTAWAVVDYQGEFRVASFDDAVTQAVCALEQK